MYEWMYICTCFLSFYQTNYTILLPGNKYQPFRAKWPLHPPLQCVIVYTALGNRVITQDYKIIYGRIGLLISQFFCYMEAYKNTLMEGEKRSWLWKENIWWALFWKKGILRPYITASYNVFTFYSYSLTLGN